MDLNDVSLSSVEDENCNEGASSIKEESHYRGSDITISNIETAEIDNHHLHKLNETAEDAKKSRIRNENSKVKDTETSVCTTGQDSSCNISLMVGNEHFKTLQTMLPFSNTEATSSSYLPKTLSSEDKLLDACQDITKKYENVSYLENPVLRLPHTAVENASNLCTSSFSGSGMDKKCLPADCTISGAESSFKECSELKTSDMCTRFNSVTIPKGKLSNPFKSVELQSEKECLPSDETSDIEMLSPNKDAITISPMLLGDETSLTSESGAAGGFHDYDNDRQSCKRKDKSVRRKIKAELPISFNSDSLPAGSSSFSNSSRKVGRSLLQMCRSLEQTSPEEDDWNIYEASGDVKDFKAKSWAQELVSFCNQIQNPRAIQRVDAEKLLEEVRHFFQHNYVDAERNLCWKDIEYRIITSKYFSDEFCQRHGLLSRGELMEDFLKNFESSRDLHLEGLLKLKELCKALVECGIFEEHFMKYFMKRLRIGEYETAPSIELRDREDYYNRHLFRIEKEFGLYMMLNLFKELREGATFKRFLHVPGNPHTKSS